MGKVLALAFGTLGVLSAAPAWADRDTERYTSVTVFGDSLVDAGNLYIANGGTRPDPALGYFQNRFTNGYDYPDLLSIDLFGVPTTPSLAGGTNFAFGGARVVDTGDGIPDLKAQISAFTASGRDIDINGIYILNFGGNDVFGAKGVFGQEGAIGSFPTIDAYLQAAASQYAAGVQTLNDLGVRNIFMTDFPLAGDPFTIAANGYLTAAIATLSLDADTDLLFYSLSDFNRRALTNPSSLGLPPQRADINCLEAGAQATGCVGIFSFDGVHPTAAVQAAGYRDINQRFGLTSVVPEPSTWAMMLVGFGLLSASLRYRRRSTKVSYA
ncbi:PEPxxWA-CTERM sorting domain-containing protein [Sphingomonas sp. CFBP 8760]|uniref:PEPxxWA-CTERM sorting domain-containing protein n=1 Tax=Sphingomonas sp. CFBP 8760 TaxID=2775282 RepID=UPI0017836280|nr:PEPxxWA-CTERM sorting domain-containing protein [Sphingomonas sp. CFBP 8760]MBD8548326.1 PEPxxWA-CTERM sorting domain-containing protein [Sphingomonas sp. CFBP 8760]